MPTSTYTPLANTTLATNAASVTFSSISQDYRDLVLVVNGNSTNDISIRFQVNGDTGANYYLIAMQGDGSSTASGSSGANGNVPSTWLTAISSASKLAWIVNFMDYSATDKHKSGLSRANYPTNMTEAKAFRWANTSAITTIRLFSEYGGNLASGTTLALYGIAA
jgi:hypothetical protein